MSDFSAARTFENAIVAAADDATAVAPVVLLEQVRSEVHARLSGRSPAADAFIEWVDKQVAEFVGSPHDPFDKMVGTAVTATAALYEPLGLTAASLRSDVPAKLSWWNGPVSSYSYARGVTARLETNPVQVSVKVCPTRFDRDNVLALPYVLFHEYVCHAARLALGGPPPSSTSSLFTEGWMDQIAIEVHDDALSCTECNGYWLDPFGHADCAQRLHDARHADPEYQDHIASGRKHGRDVARQVEVWFPSTRPLPHRLWALSAGLNGSQLTDNDLNSFVLAVDRVLGSESARNLFSDVLNDTNLSPEQVLERTLQLAG